MISPLALSQGLFHTRRILMEQKYEFREIEAKWQGRWEQGKCFAASDDYSKPKYYVLIEFPYPSGAGLHVGHPRSYTALDTLARKRRMQGYNVLYPIGWDAFGLPTENHAIKTGEQPAVVTKRNIARYRTQLKKLGFSFDWDREVDTTDPRYYKWTQWIFLKLWENGLAYKAEIPINWCTSCKIGLANEEVVGGVCERCGGEVVRKVKKQWMLKITDYAERLLDDLDTVDFLPKIKMQQVNWIGRSYGAEVDFKVADAKEEMSLRVFTTRPDTMFGATFMVISPEHPFMDDFLTMCSNPDEVAEYCEAAARKSDFERTEVSKEMTGCPIAGVYCINPADGKKIPVWTADYVLASYGTGAIMAVPGHDDRDWRFATKYGLPIIEVIKGGDVTKEAYCDTDKGMLVNSGFLDGMEVKEAIEAMTAHLAEMGIASKKVNYKLRDWVFSRQRYWGEPIPMVECDECGWVPVPESELPLTLPEVERYQATETGESPLAQMTDWVSTICPHCAGPARRETDTMPNWAGSSWYFLRYTDPLNEAALASSEALDYWMPVDWYNGGMEHTTLHLLYSRFWHKFLYDIGVVSTPEPYAKRTSHGLVLGEDNEKMSKSRGNVVNPDEMVDKFGADAFRLIELFMGAFDQPIPWSTNGLIGMQRFLYRIWDLQDKLGKDEGQDFVKTERLVHQAIRKVGEDIESQKYNTAVAQLMSLANAFGRKQKVDLTHWVVFLKLLAPFAPHIAEEMYERAGFEGGLSRAAWPEFDPEKAREEEVEVPVQVNGKLRDVVKVSADADEPSMLEAAMASERVKAALGGRRIRKHIVIPGKMVNLVAD